VPLLLVDTIALTAKPRAAVCILIWGRKDGRKLKKKLIFKTRKSICEKLL